jgi:hypothetical protein
LLVTPNVQAANYKLAAARIPSDQVAFAQCVSHRESRGNYQAASRVSSARGRWQFLDRQWREGLSYMVANRLVDYGMPKQKRNALVKRLQSKPIDAWKPLHQDIGFVAALNAKHPWSGWRHWYFANSPCNKLVPHDKR